MTSVAPFIIFFAGALLAAVTRGRVRSVIMLAVPLIGAWNLYTLAGSDTVMSYTLLDLHLVLVKVDKLSLVFGILFHLAAFLGILFSLHEDNTTESVSALLYAGTGLGAVFAGDLLTMFLFWEGLAITSTFLVLARRTRAARGSALRYLVIQVLSGVILLAGILMHYQETGSLAFGAIGIKSLSGLLIFIAIGIKCGFPLVHNWLTDAYPESTPGGTVFLSVFTTKVAVYALARGFAGTEILITIGAVMTMFPIFFAVIENDLRRVLSYSMVNQIGFMVCGIGLGGELGINGAISHAFNDVIFKALLFMSMGAVMFRTGTTKASELGGLYKSMPLTAGFCIVGSASISALPLFSGFVSKSMVMVAAAEQGHPIVWLALLFASAGVMEHAGIKIPFFAFFSHDSGIRTREAPKNMLLAMGLAAAICIFNGAYPWVLYSLMPLPVHYNPYTASHVLTQTQLLLFSTLAFVVLKQIGIYPPELPSTNIDVEWIYRRAGPRLVRWMLDVGGRVDRVVRVTCLRRVERFIAGLMHFHGPSGVMARTWEIGNSVMVITLVLALFLVLFYA